MPSYTKTVWQDLPNTTTPVNATNLNNIENGIETLYNNQTVVNDSYNASTTETYSCNYVNNLKSKVLWENSNISTNFAGQTITLSEPIENFNYYTVLFYQAANSTLTISTSAKAGDTIRAITIGGSLLNYRDVTSISGTSCTFSNTTAYSTYAGSGSTANQRLIPYQIIGHYI
jgi:hypothetical protein